MNIKAIGFDIDGTLYRNSIMYLRNISFGIKNRKLLKALKKVRDGFRKSGESPQKGEDFYTYQARHLASELGQEETEIKNKLQSLIYSHWENSLKGISLPSGLIDCLLKLKKAGFKLGLLSDFPIGNKVKSLGIDIDWDYAIGSETLGYLKPHRIPFDNLVAGLGCHNNEVLYIGNSYKSDIIGAVNAGLFAAHFTFLPKTNSLAHYSFNNYLKLSQWIFKKTEITALHI